MLENLFPLLMCPYCGENPEKGLELHTLESSDQKSGKRINNGVIYCQNCTRFFLIQDEILSMLLDNVREKGDELLFLSKWRTKLPEYITLKAKPFNLKENQ
ncbi:MAG: hypothetical protein ACFFD1_01770 [Candidatus Thorarchaeota archaeon]